MSKKRKRKVIYQDVNAVLLLSDIFSITARKFEKAMHCITI